MSDMKILSELIRDDALIPPHSEYGKPAVLLRERQAQDSTMTIHNIPKDAMIINADVFAAPKGIFKNTKHECKRADYVIISEDKKCIIYIEMKRGDGDKIVQQLMGAQCFVRYCREIGKAFWNKEDFLHEYKSRFIAALHTGARKRRTRHTSDSDCHDTPVNPMRLAGRKFVQFTDIAK